MTGGKAALLTGLILLLPACISARMYSQEQIATVTNACGFAIGEIFQDAEEPRILFLLAHSPPAAGVACVGKWARKRNLRLAAIEGIEFENAPQN